MGIGVQTTRQTVLITVAILVDSGDVSNTHTGTGDCAGGGMKGQRFVENHICKLWVILGSRASLGVFSPLRIWVGDFP